MLLCSKLKDDCELKNDPVNQWGAKTAYKKSICLELVRIMISEINIYIQIFKKKEVIILATFMRYENGSL